MSSRFHQTYGIHTAKPRTSTRGTGLFAYAVLSYRGRRYMRPATAIKNNATMMAKGRAKITPAQLRIRPARAGTPCCFATRPCQIPRTFSNGATTTICRPPLSKSWTNNQHRKAGIRSLPFYRLVPFARRKVACSHVASNRPCCQRQTAGCHFPGRAWHIRDCNQKLHYFGAS